MERFFQYYRFEFPDQNLNPKFSTNGRNFANHIVENAPGIVSLLRRKKMKGLRTLNFLEIQTTSCLEPDF